VWVCSWDLGLRVGRILVNPSPGAFHRFLMCRVVVISEWRISYKLYCYAYFLNSVAHEAEFRNSKLGASQTPKPTELCFASFIYCVCFLPVQSIMVCCVHFLCTSQCHNVLECCLMCEPSLWTSRATCVEATRFDLPHFPPCNPSHLHTTPPAGGDVLQIRAAGGLQRPPSTHAAL
jgi:hypothetical protein